MTTRRIKIPSPLKGQLVRRTKRGYRPKSYMARKIRDVLLTAQGNFCSICGKEFSVVSRITLDHTFSKRYQYTNNGNMTVAHYDCNHAKGGDTPRGCDLIWLQVANTALVYHPPTIHQSGFWNYFPKKSPDNDPE